MHNFFFSGVLSPETKTFFGPSSVLLLVKFSNLKLNLPFHCCPIFIFSHSNCNFYPLLNFYMIIYPIYCQSHSIQASRPTTPSNVCRLLPIFNDQPFHYCKNHIFLIEQKQRLPFSCFFLSQFSNSLGCAFGCQHIVYYWVIK